MTNDKYIGYVASKDLPAWAKPGLKVEFKKGARLFSRKTPYIATRRQVITISHVLHGTQGADITTQNPMVCWAGSSGYWVQCDINDVTPIPQSRL